MSHSAVTGFKIVRDRRDPDAVERLLRSLPDWFGLEDSIVDYVNDARTKTTYLAVDESGYVLGALLVTRHNPESAEMHLLAVDPERHREGIGTALVRSYEDDMRHDGVILLQVKTMGPSEPDEYYARTTAFYLAMGYLPLEELHGYWPEDNPCLILVKAIRT
jgi:ribosomal protein S18 acetylase RimI-like enzyme